MSYFIELDIMDSTLISSIEYFEEQEELEIKFKKYYVDKLVYREVPLSYFIEFSEAKSFGKFYLQYIKPNFKLKHNPQNMADLVIKCKINILKVIKDWFFQGEKGVYFNFTILYNKEQDAYKNNGLIIQDVPTEIYKADKTKKGEILGNCRVWENSGAGSEEGQPGKESGKMGIDGISDDLPF